LKNKWFEQITAADATMMVDKMCGVGATPSAMDLHKIVMLIQPAHNAQVDKDNLDIVNHVAWGMYCGYFCCVCWPCTALTSCCIGGHYACKHKSDLEELRDAEGRTKRYRQTYLAAVGCV
jgi:hypothetical protein